MKQRSGQNPQRDRVQANRFFPLLLLGLVSMALGADRLVFRGREKGVESLRLEADRWLLVPNESFDVTGNVIVVSKKQGFDLKCAAAKGTFRGSTKSTEIDRLEAAGPLTFRQQQEIRRESGSVASETTINARNAIYTSPTAETANVKSTGGVQMVTKESGQGKGATYTVSGDTSIANIRIVDKKTSEITNFEIIGDVRITVSQQPEAGQKAQVFKALCDKVMYSAKVDGLPQMVLIGNLKFESIGEDDSEAEITGATKATLILTADNRLKKLILSSEGGHDSHPGETEKWRLERSKEMKIQAYDLQKEYKKRKVVRGVSYEISTGEIVGLLGPNGAGKTTTFYMTVGLVRPNAGRVTLDDRDITKLPMYRRARMGIGYLPQETSVFRKLSVEDNLKLVLELNGVTGAKQRAKVDELCEELHITHILKSQAGVLSGGERRRVEIARAMATEPSFILLDEPFTGIDPVTIEEIQAILFRLKERGIGILITDHNVGATLRITDRNYILIDGQIIAEGTGKAIAENESVRKHYLGQQFGTDIFEEPEHGA